MGSHLSAECQIDAIAQSWSVLSSAGGPERCAQAMQALDTHLVNQQAGFIRLLTPPFNGNGPNPGYIQGYVPGARENGGQYTHGAIWAIMAFAHSGNRERAWELWSLINPINRSLTLEATARYKVKPYVMTADIYSVEPHTGHGGWSWYTGSAGWAYRLIVETLLGISRQGDTLTISTSLPHDWPSASLRYQHGSSRYDITLKTAATNTVSCWMASRYREKGYALLSPNCPFAPIKHSSSAPHSAMVRYGLTPIILNPLSMGCSRISASTMPIIFPLPPSELTPPSTTAKIAVSR